MFFKNRTFPSDRLFFPSCSITYLSLQHRRPEQAAPTHHLDIPTELLGYPLVIFPSYFYFYFYFFIERIFQKITTLSDTCSVEELLQTVQPIHPPADPAPKTKNPRLQSEFKDLEGYVLYPSWLNRSSRALRVEDM